MCLAVHPRERHLGVVLEVRLEQDRGMHLGVYVTQVESPMVVLTSCGWAALVKAGQLVQLVLHLPTDISNAVELVR